MQSDFGVTFLFLLSLTDLHLSSGGCRSRCAINLRDLQASPAKVCLLDVGILGVVVGDGGLDAVLGEHAAVQLDRWQAEFLGNVCVLDLRGLVQRHPADELGEVRGRGNGASAAKGLELDVGDRV